MGKKMRKCCKKRKAVVLLVVFLVFGIVIIWIRMQQSTDAVVQEIENAIQNDTYCAVTEGGLTREEQLLLDENQAKYEEYRWDQVLEDYRLYYSPTRGMAVETYLDGYKIQNVEIHRNYTFHNFQTGYVWIVVHFDVVDKNGTVIASHQGGPKAGTKFRIKRQNGKWQITDFYEQNSHETISEEIHYLLPDWDLTKQ